FLAVALALGEAPAVIARPVDEKQLRTVLARPHDDTTARPNDVLAAHNPRSRRLRRRDAGPRSLLAGVPAPRRPLTAPAPGAFGAGPLGPARCSPGYPARDARSQPVAQALRAGLLPDVRPLGARPLRRRALHRSELAGDVHRARLAEGQCVRAEPGGRDHGVLVLAEHVLHVGGGLGEIARGLAERRFHHFGRVARPLRADADLVQRGVRCRIGELADRIAQVLPRLAYEVAQRVGMTVADEHHHPRSLRGVDKTIEKAEVALTSQPVEQHSARSVALVAEVLEERLRRGSVLGLELVDTTFEPVE